MLNEGASGSMPVVVVYNSKYHTPTQALSLIATNDTSGLVPLEGNSTVPVSVPAELNPSQSTIVPHYAVLLHKTGKVIHVAAVAYDEQSGQFIVPIGADENGNPVHDIIAIVFNWKPVAGSWRRMVLYNDNGVWRYTAAPIYLQIKLEDGNDIIVPVGLPPLIAALIIGGVIAGGIAAIGFVFHARAKEKVADALKKAVDYAVRNNKPEVIVAALQGVDAVRREEDSGGDLKTAILKAIAEFGAPIVAIIVLMLKFRVFIDIIRDLFRRGR